MRSQIEAVREILAELDLANKPELLVLNKADRLTLEERDALAKRTGGVCISALKGEGIEQLLGAVDRMLVEGDQR
jgi:GTP-binding protein HflX